MEVIHLLTFGERLKSERIRKEIILEKMAEDLKTTKATLSRYENNLREPKISFIKEVADYFQCCTDYILGRTDNRMGIIVEGDVEENNGNTEIDKNMYPYGLTYEQVVKILESLKKAGFKWDARNK